MEDEIAPCDTRRTRIPSWWYLRRPCLRPSRHQRILLYSKWRGRPPTKRSGFLELIDPIVVMAALADSTSYLLIDFLLRGHSERNCQGTACRCHAVARDLTGPSPTVPSHSLSFDKRRRPETSRTAIATAFFWPTNTTSFLPRVMPV